MKRMIILLIVLLVTTVGFSQEWPHSPFDASKDSIDAIWPESFAGDRMKNGDFIETEMYLESWLDFNPWGMVNPVGKHFYFGTLEFRFWEGLEVAYVDIHTMAYRHCFSPPWGSTLPDPCFYYQPRAINYAPYYLPWNENAHAYLLWADAYWGMPVVVLTMSDSSGSGVMKFGTMQVIDGNVVWDTSHTLYTYLISPFEAEQSLPSARRGEIRRMK